MSDTPENARKDKQRSVDARTIHGSIQIVQASPRPSRKPLAVSQATDPVDESSQQTIESEDVPPRPAGQSPGLTILQWLTYAFWGWTLLAVIWLVYIVVENFIIGGSTTGLLPYAIATSLVLLPLSVVCDFFYSRKEVAKKSGIATVVMVIHAVIFALIGIGVLIGAVVVVVQLLVDGGVSNNDGRMTALATLLISALLYGMTFLRTLNPSPRLKNGRYFSMFMALTVGVFIVLAFIGPLAQSVTSRDDRAIAQNINSINHAVQEYIQTNKAMPQTLGDVSIDSDVARRLIGDGLVTYRPGEIVASTEYGQYSQSAYSDYRYSLCATFATELEARYKDEYYYEKEHDGYSTSLHISSHPAGEVCYKLKTTIAGAARAIDIRALKL